jgi:hypothetical protein
VDQSSGSFFVGSVKEGTIHKGKVGRPSLEVFSAGGAESARSVNRFIVWVRDLLVNKRPV